MPRMPQPPPHRLTPRCSFSVTAATHARLEALARQTAAAYLGCPEEDVRLDEFTATPEVFGNGQVSVWTADIEACCLPSDVLDAPDVASG